MKVTYLEHCGNSPKKLLLIELHKAMLVSNDVRNFHRVSKWFKPPGGSPEFVQG